MLTVEPLPDTPNIRELVEHAARQALEWATITREDAQRAVSSLLRVLAALDDGKADLGAVVEAQSALVDALGSLSHALSAADRLRRDVRREW